MIKLKKIPVSLVIPTLGKKHIISCLNSINSSSHLPRELLIVVPKDNYNKIKSKSLIFKNLNIRVIESYKKNQVYQRILGFRKAKYNYIMQLDDDVKLKDRCLFNLYEFIKGKKKIAVAPRYSDKLPLSKIYSHPTSFLLKTYHWLLNSKKGYSPGTVALCGFNYADEKSLFGSKTHEWLSGGAIMHHKKNLIIENYYPYEFKRSICEDLLHSLILRQKKIRLIKLYSANVSATESSRINNELSLSLIIKNLINEFLIRKYIVKKFRFSIFRLYVYYFIYSLRLLLTFVKNEQ